MSRLFRFVCSFAVVVVLASMALSESPGATTEPLWPGRGAGSTGTADGDVPQLIITRVDSDKPTAAVVILPGGGYHGHAMDHEGYQFAEWFRSLGLTSAICTYRLRGKGNDGKGYGHPIPMQDAQRAVQTLRARATELNIDPQRIGAIGFSAGGHLCSTISTHFADGDQSSEDPVTRVSSRPDFSILCYPVIAFDQKDHSQRKPTKLAWREPGPCVDRAVVERAASDGENAADVSVPHGRRHSAVPVENSVQYFAACKKNGVPAELHVFPKGRHGLGLAKDTPGASQWPELCERWLRSIGVVTAP